MADDGRPWQTSGRRRARRRAGGWEDRPHAATAAGVGERTAFRRLTDPAFKARVSELRGGMVTAAAGRLADGMAAAADVLRELLTHDDPHVRHRAAVKVLEVAVSLRSQVEFEERIAALEAGQEERRIA